MKLAFVLLALSSLWLNSCVGIQQKTNKTATFEEMWTPILSVLNQGSVDAGLRIDDLFKIYDDELAQIEERWRIENGEVAQKNAYYFEALSAKNRSMRAGLTNGNLSRADAEAMARHALDVVKAHKTASSASTRNYDAGEEIGFCFGRALFVHFLLLQAGLSQDNLAKVFAVGNFLIGGQFWRFHVAIMIKTAEGFLMVDPLYGDLVYLDDWMVNVASLDVKKPLSRTRFYVTDPRKFMPTTGSYALDLLSPPEIKLYFDDLGRSLMH